MITSHENQEYVSDNIETVDRILSRPLLLRISSTYANI